MTKSMYNRIEDYLSDDDFILYAIDGCSKNMRHWEACALNPSHSVSSSFKKALHIIQNLDNCTSLTEEEIAILKSRIFKTLKLRTN